MAMIAMPSIDENLTLVVEKSKKVLDTDTSFIALHDEKTDELCWHISSGLVTERFKRLHVSMGRGLVGKVAQSSQWIVAEDYFKEIGPDFQSVTREEGMTSGIVVLIQIGQTNYGSFSLSTEQRPIFLKRIWILCSFSNILPPLKLRVSVRKSNFRTVRSDIENSMNSPKGAKIFTFLS